MPEEVKDAEQKLKDQEKAAEQQVDSAGAQAEKDAKAQGATPDEVKAAVEKARKEEKDKLYPQIETLKGNIDDLKKLIEEERNEKVAAQKKAKDDAEVERQSKLTAEQKTAETLLRLEEQLKEERREREKFRKQIEAREAQDSLDRYRDKLIQANADSIIPELVRGSTVEELDESLAIAKSRYEELAEKFKQKSNTDTRNRMPRSTNPDLEALEELELSKDLTQVDGDKYLKDPEYRARIKAELEQAYRELAGQR